MNYIFIEISVVRPVGFSPHVGLRGRWFKSYIGWVRDDSTACQSNSVCKFTDGVPVSREGLISSRTPHMR